MNTGLGSKTVLSFEDVPASTLGRHSISFDSSAVDSTWDMWNQNGMDDLSSVVKPIRSKSNSAVLSDSGLSQGGTSSGSFVPDGNLGLKHDTGLAVEWSVEEQYTLERITDKYKNEQSIIKYIRIAAALPDKTVRDVALRCRWMTRKRRKYEEHYSGKKVTNRKDKLMEICPKTSLPLAKPFNMFTVTHSLLMQQRGRSGLSPLDVASTSGENVKQSLQQNFEVFDQISNNMSSYKFQENIELFLRTKNNITEVLNEMGQLPGLPQLPVTINEDLLNFMVPDVNQKRDMLTKYRHLKQLARS